MNVGDIVLDFYHTQKDRRASLQSQRSTVSLQWGRQNALGALEQSVHECCVHLAALSYPALAAP